MPYNYLFAIILGSLPSIIWLIFYLRKDIHPEPKKWLFLIFLAGMAITPIVIIIEQQIAGLFNYLNSISPIFFNTSLKNIAIIFIGVAAIEEFAKFAVVRLTMKNNPVLDEPADAMIYMIVAALGFAAIENILVMNVFASSILIAPAQPLLVLAMRSVGATFLHTLTSAIIGFYYALSLTENDKSKKDRYLLAKGFLIAILLHGIFNYFIIILNKSFALYFSIPLFIIAIFVLKDFKILQGISSKKFNNF